jgi:hypothetical protein
MLMLFTTAKPFRGHSGTIQRNALKSWMLIQDFREALGPVRRALGLRAATV